MGDPAAKPVFDSPTPFDVLGPGYQRPFELATLRLFNMMGILPKCELIYSIFVIRFILYTCPPVRFL